MDEYADLMTEVEASVAHYLGIDRESADRLVARSKAGREWRNRGRSRTVRNITEEIVKEFAIAGAGYRLAEREAGIRTHDGRAL